MPKFQVSVTTRSNNVDHKVTAEVDARDCHTAIQTALNDHVRAADMGAVISIHAFNPAPDAAGA